MAKWMSLVSLKDGNSSKQYAQIEIFYTDDESVWLSDTCTPHNDRHIKTSQYTGSWI